VIAPPSPPPILIPSACTGEPPTEPEGKAFKGVDAYQDNIAGVKTALVDVVTDFNVWLRDYVAPLRAKESSCRGGLKAQGQ